MTTAFMFDADSRELGGHYGHPCLRQLAMAVSSSNEAIRHIESRILIGDLRLDHFCERTDLVSLADDRVTRRVAINKDLYITLLWDVAEAISTRWHTADVDELPLILARHNTFAVTLSSVSGEIAEEIDGHLHSFTPYLGAAEVDLGNRVQRYLFVESLLFHHYLRNGDVFYEHCLGDEEAAYPDWAQGYMGRIHGLSVSDFLNTAPILPEFRISERGAMTEHILDIKGRLSHADRLISEITFVRQVGRPTPFTFSSAGAEVIIPKEKLAGYALNSNHPQGRHKARLFRDLLDIGAEDWRYLAAQITEGLSTADLTKMQQTRFGIKYHVDLPIMGRNGRSKTVRSCWIAMSSGEIRLTSIYVAGEAQQTGEEGHPPPVVMGDVDRWARLYALADAAGLEAARATIPTPMVLDGDREVYHEGECGVAYIMVQDARTGFARWLRGNGIGHSSARSGQIVPARVEGQSVQRAEAYAQAFAKVLKMNGVQCSVGTVLT